MTAQSHSFTSDLELIYPTRRVIETDKYEHSLQLGICSYNGGETVWYITTN